MRILHCCLAAFYIDDFSYQENIVPRIHKELGHDVRIIASTETYLNKVVRGYIKPSSYISRDGIPVTRLPYVRWLPPTLAKKLRIYSGIDAELQEFQPEVVFLHDCQFLSIYSFVKYARRTGATIYVDSHTDFVNSGKSFVSRNILHRGVYRLCANAIQPYTKRFYATLPLRADFLRNVYAVPGDKIELLPFGADDSRIDQSERNSVRAAIRRELQIPDNALVLIAGGKIDRRKAIHVLLERFCELSENRRLKDAYLVLFGQPTDDLRACVEAAVSCPYVRSVGWVDALEIHKYLWAADIAIFPGTHSVLWEEAVGLGVPCVFRRWAGIEHVDLGGNCLFLDEVNAASLDEMLIKLTSDPAMVDQLRLAAVELGPKSFSYTEIARRAIENATCER